MVIVMSHHDRWWTLEMIPPLVTVEDIFLRPSVIDDGHGKIYFQLSSRNYPPSLGEEIRPPLK